MTSQPINQSDYDALRAELDAAYAEIARLRSEAAQSDQSYRDLFENAGDSIFIADIDYVILDVNPDAVHRFGYERDELLGMSLNDIQVLDADAAGNAIAWVSTLSGMHVSECHYRHKNGDLIPVEVSSRIIRSGEQDLIQYFVRNIAKRKQIEIEREQLIADLEGFAHTVAHDLKNPLALILGYAYTLEADWGDWSDEEVRQSLHTIVTSSQRVVSIIDTLLLFASVRSQDDIEREMLDMASIVADSHDRLAHMLKTSQAKVIIPAEWPVAVGYAPWVTEIWVNYLSNAIKYGGTPPVIEIGGTRQPDNTVCFWVRDNGMGIGPEKLARVFGKFDRLGEVHIEGHGLGLSIVKRITEKLGGWVSVESIVGEGSTFSFILPTAPGGPMRQPA